jgi:hypothetical protein
VVPAVLRASCFNRRVWVRFDLDNRLVFVAFALPALVAMNTNSLKYRFIHRPDKAG